MIRQTRIQKILRPVIRKLVEKFFPRGAFYGDEFLRGLKTDTNLIGKWGSVEMACALYIMTTLRKAGATTGTFEAHDVTDEGVPVGSWKVTVEKVE